MSESDHTGLGDVLPRWDDILQHLESKAKDFPDLQTFLGPDEGFSKWYNRQIFPIHIIAFYLCPNNGHLNATPDSRLHLFNFFNQYAKSQADATILREEYVYYITQMAPFTFKIVFFIYHP